MANILPRDLPVAASVNPTAAIIVDNGVNVEKATPEQVVATGRPLASQAEAEAGVENSKAMTPLRVAQAIAGSAVIDGIDQRLDNIETLTPEGESASIALQQAVTPFPTQGRCRIDYATPTSVRVFLPEHIIMGGHRIFGQYRKTRSPVFATGVNGFVDVSLVSDLAVEASVHANNWYAVFAVANAGDASVSFRLMPYFRVGTIVEGTFTFTYGGSGANAHSLNPTTYTIVNDALVGSECLLVNENGNFSGRIELVVSNTDSDISLSNSGALAAFDFVLPSPPSFDYYAYLGSFYRDANEPQNLADSCDGASAYTTNLADPDWPASGAIASPGVKIDFSGYIPPLATAVQVGSVENVVTATVSGTSSILFSHDSSNHVIGQHFATKANTANLNSVEYLLLRFSKGQYAYAYTNGTLQAARSSCSLQIRGWTEV